MGAIRERVSPQPGPQTAFLSSPADIAIYGGSAGGGKSFALLLEAARHVDKPGYGAVIFRRTLADVKKEGSLWDSSLLVYGVNGARPRLDTLTWTWGSGAKVGFGHLEHEKTVLDWQGAQIACLCFDELTHFSRSQFFYMLSRNRSTCGIRPYIRASTNPDPDSWVAQFIAWWLDQTTGLPIEERSGVIRWFVQINDQMIWADSAAELQEQWPGSMPKSVTFIPAKLEDNKILEQKDPGYRANLMAMTTVERERLLSGNWKIRPAAGLLFRREWCEVVEAIPADCDIVRYWDRAATEKTEGNDPDLSVGIKMARQRTTGFYYLIDARWGFYSPARGDMAIKNTAAADGTACRIGVPQDPGQAGKSQAQATIRMMDGFSISAHIETGDKVTRFAPFSAQAEAGNVKILRGFDEEVLRRLEAFPDGRYKDDADACSGAYEMFHTMSSMGLLGWMQQQIAERDGQVAK